MDILPGFLQVCKIQELELKFRRNTERWENEIESDNEDIENSRPWWWFLQTGFAINQFKLAELDDTLEVLLEILSRYYV